MPEPRPQALGYLLVLLGVAIFGATLPMTRLAVGDMGPSFLTAGRAALAGLIALVVLAAARRPLPPRAAWWRIALGGSLLAVGFSGFIALAMRSVPAFHGGVVLGVLPLATAIAATLIDRERPSPAFWLCGVAGAAVLTVFALRRGGGHAQAADLWLIGAILSTSIGYTVSAQLSRTMPGWEVISWQVVFMLPVSLLGAWWFWPPGALDLPGRDWFAFLYLGVMSQYVGFFFWNAGLAITGIARGGQVQLLQTLITLAISAVLLGEEIDPETFVFAGIIVTLVAMGRRAQVARSVGPA